MYFVNLYIVCSLLNVCAMCNAFSFVRTTDEIEIWSKTDFSSKMDSLSQKTLNNGKKQCKIYCGAENWKNSIKIFAKESITLAITHWTERSTPSNANEQLIFYRRLKMISIVCWDFKTIDCITDEFTKNERSLQWLFWFSVSLCWI